VGSTRWETKFPLNSFTQARITVNVMTKGSTGSTLAAQYSIDNGASWSYLDGSSGPSVGISASTGLVVSSWVNLAAAAKSDVMLRIVGAGGNAVASPAFGRIDIQVK
jgi:hypothetical protein